MDNKLEFIRQKCVEVNLDRPWHELADVGGVVVWKDSPVRLADVLLAIKAKADVMDGMGYTFVYCDGDFSTVRTQGLSASWNLRKDDLSEQSDETINFIYDLLCQNK